MKKNIKKQQNQLKKDLKTLYSILDAGWTKKAYHRDRHGHIVSIKNPLLKRSCLVGGMCRTIPFNEFDFKPDSIEVEAGSRIDNLIEAVARTINPEVDDNDMLIQASDFNDQSSKKEVLELVKKAISNCK